MTKGKRMNWREGPLGLLSAVLIGAAALSLFVFVLLLLISPFYKKVHIGHRVKGSISVTLDGEPVKIQELMCEGEGIGIPMIRYNENRVKYSIRGNKYERYEYTCTLSEGLPAIKIAYDHFNWWEVSTTDLILELFSDLEGRISYTAHFKGRFLGEDDEWIDWEKDITGSEENGTIKLWYD